MPDHSAGTEADASPLDAVVDVRHAGPTPIKQDLATEHWPYELMAARAWQLRANLTIYDANYVALAELLDATLVTLDPRIGRAPGPRCAIAKPDPCQPRPEPSDTNPPRRRSQG